MKGKTQKSGVVKRAPKITHGSVGFMHLIGTVLATQKSNQKENFTEEYLNFFSSHRKISRKVKGSWFRKLWHFTNVRAHQGATECARRVKQRALGTLTPNYVHGNQYSIVVVVPVEPSFINFS